LAPITPTFTLSPGDFDSAGSWFCAQAKLTTPPTKAAETPDCTNSRRETFAIDFIIYASMEMRPLQHYWSVYSGVEGECNHGEHRGHRGRREEQTELNADDADEC
jgi:hypothetical protein